MNVARLGDHAKFLSGFAFKSKLFNDDGTGLPVVRIRDVVRGHSETFYSGEYDKRYIVSRGDYLIGMDGEFNLARWQSEKALLNQRVCKIDSISDGVDRDYLGRFLPVALKEIEDATPFVTVKHLSVKALNELQIPLPPLAEQKRIAGILDAADALRAKRRESLAQLDTLLQSTFLDMFGDPVTNPMGWEVEKLSKVTNFSQGIQIGLESHKEIQAEGLSRFLRISDFTKEGCEPRYVPTPSKRYHASADEVIMIRYGEAGRVVRGLDGFIANNLFKISPIEDNFHNTYLFYFLGSPRIADRIKSTSAITSMPQVSHKTVGQLLTPVPPLDLQHRFAAIVESVEQQKASQRAHLDELDTLFASLQSRAFQGGL